MTTAATPAETTPAAPVTETLSWQWQGRQLDVGLTRQGSGPTLLMLPALSTISTRAEFAALQAALADRFTTVAIDWPGFGDRPRPFIDWSVETLLAFVDHLFTAIDPRPAGVVAAGHAGGLMMRYLRDHPGAVERLILVAPTWRGPLPTMTRGDYRPWFARLRRWFDQPFGRTLYWLNTREWCIHRMADEHVYETPRYLNAERMAIKRRVPASPGARHASIRFVTGALDAFRTRDAALAAMRGITSRTLMMTTPHMPRRSGENMEALATLEGVETHRLPHGRLLVHEEYPADVAEAIRRWWP
ncbi:pimeloyl-ACP methyl ester carboxylesterase [Kushneria sinocarnis]|uniref:Pimeloyl-ACP methyl ester carboxylesterase n=1 Tax=Kushneria sinocarnis TaxID=595502 RepID=A0A420X156_9GAMM|nr:alpha/beta hydrolase [Kushneria sinocarnis]RKR07477.1 pimeloyl-ACP methyl ester carboxylesterase [Kushneria sinocarnis]